MKSNSGLSKYLTIVGLLFLLIACDSKKDKDANVVARVNEAYMYSSELESFIPNGTSEEDSLMMTMHFLDSWATQRLLLDAAAFNLTDTKKAEIEELVDKFRTDLLTSAYLELLVQQNVDTLIGEADLKNYYEANKKKFLTDDILVQMRYVNVMNGNPKMNLIKKYFLSTKKEDFSKLEDLSLQMKSYALNDTIWVNGSQIYERLPFISSENVTTYLSENLFYEVKDSVSTYMVKVYKVLGRNSIAPYDYLKPTLELMLLNNRKMELMKKLQKDILDDATKNKRYEVYK